MRGGDTGDHIPLGNLGFDPVYTAAQIVTLQASYYLAVGLGLACAGFVWGRDPDLDGVFILERTNLQKRWDVLFSHVAASVCTGYLVHRIVERSKRCLDFSLTLYAIHLVLTCVVAQGLPLNPPFYVLLSFCAALTYGTSRHLCKIREMSDVSLRQPRSSNPLLPT